MDIKGSEKEKSAEKVNSGTITIAIAVLTVALSAVQIGAAILQRQTDLKIAEKNLQHEVMSKYLEEMTELILLEDDSEQATKGQSPEVQTKNEEERFLIANAMTLNASRQLTDPERKGQLLKFLYDAKLIGRCNTDLQKLKVSNCEEAKIYLTGIKLLDAKLEQPMPPLSGINLSGASLNGASLSEITLTRANLSAAKLKNSDLTKAVLNAAEMQGVHLEGAILTGALLQGADLENALLMNADLRGADLSNARLQNANLSDADLSNTTLKGAEYNQPGTVFPDGFDPATQGMIQK